MSFASFTCDVDASVETLWRLLEDKIENPGRYLPEVEDSEILERGSAGILRRMKTALFEVTERITVDRARLEIDYVLVDHPELAGHLFDRITPPREDEPEGRPLLTSTLDWRSVEGKATDGMGTAGIGTAGEELLELITATVLQVKELAEEAERARHGRTET